MKTSLSLNDIWCIHKQTEIHKQPPPESTKMIETKYTKHAHIRLHNIIKHSIKYDVIYDDTLRRYTRHMPLTLGSKWWASL